MISGQQFAPLVLLVMSAFYQRAQRPAPHVYRAWAWKNYPYRV